MADNVDRAWLIGNEGPGIVLLCCNVSVRVKPYPLSNDSSEKAPLKLDKYQEIYNIHTN